jgi:hypothetical protein
MLETKCEHSPDDEDEIEVECDECDDSNKNKIISFKIYY